VEVCAAISDLRDEVLLGLCEAALGSLGPEEAVRLSRQIALVAHGGFGRRDVAPYSDVDLMILRAPGDVEPVGLLAERLLRDVFDVGLVPGHSVRTAEEACQLACEDATIASSLVESRFLAGSVSLFVDFVRRFQAQVRRRTGVILAAMEQSRLEERAKFGETVYLLEPNLKRSRGGLRDVQLLRWTGAIRHGTPEPDELVDRGALPRDDRLALAQATEFLLRLRNELHFQAGKPSDVLDRAEQVRIAALRGYQGTAGLLPVEQFMREYFRHTDRVSHVVSSFVAKCRPARRLRAMAARLFGHRIPGGYVVGPTEFLPGHRALNRLRGSLVEIMRLVNLAGLYDKPIGAEAWDVVREEAARLPRDPEIPAEARRLFLALLGRSGRLGESLRGLHEVGLLEYFVPAFSHARGLLQFNQYHKHTVDEHSLRAVEGATDLLADPGPVGRVYRGIERKGVLHLALLIHDLGKGFEEDHLEVGLRIARETAARLGLDEDESEILAFLVHKHLRMNHVAFRRDTSDEQLVVQFAVEVGSPELLQMLYVFTACDVAAVGPDAWTGWKAEVLTDLYHRTMQPLAGESPSTSREEYLEGRREEVRACLGAEAAQEWFLRHVALLPISYLNATGPDQIADDLRLLARLGPREVNAQGRYQPDTGTVQFTIGAKEDVTPGIFHKLTGALTSRGLEILSAQINTFADLLVLDRFWVVDPDYSGQPPPERLEQINRALVSSLMAGGKPPTFRSTWTIGGPKRLTLTRAQTRVLIDNRTSAHYTVIDIFTVDRRGLLYTITRTLFELGYSVWRAKIGTYLDQVVDVFYVTDRQGGKVEDPDRIHHTRQRLLEVIEAMKVQ
jgi:[protein-PII] uridylyltransferase